MSSMELSSGSPLMKIKDINLNKERRRTGKVLEISELIRAVRRGIKMTKKYLEDQNDLDAMTINETDLTGKNIFHLCSQREELLEFLLGAFKNHPQLKQTLYMEDINGHTPAHLAVLQNEKKSIQLLMTSDNNLLDVRSKLTGKSLVHCAVESGSEYIVHDIIEERPDSIFDKDVHSRPPLHYAAALKENNILEYLLSQGVDIMESDDTGYTALHVAAEYGYISNVQLLLNHDIELIKLMDKSDQTVLHVASKNGHGNVVSLLLESGADILLRDVNGDTVLECAMANKRQDVIEILLMSDCWRELITEYQGGSRRCFVYLVTYMPRSATILLDRCIERSDDDPSSENHSVSYDFFLLESSGTNPRKLDGLSAILKNAREDCLMHNVTRKFLSVKWRGKGYKLYLANLLTYLIFHILFNTYIILIRGAVTTKSLKGVGSGVSTTPRVLDYPKPEIRPDDTSAIIAVAIIVPFTILNLLKEFVQMYLQKWKYFRQVTNYFEWILYISVLFFLFPVRKEKTARQYGAGCIAVFFTWFNLIWFMRRIPAVGTYILALQKVFMTLVKMLPIILLFCLAFASIFHLLLAEYPRYNRFHIAILSSFVSTLGDFDYDDLFVEVGYHQELYNFKIASFVIFMLLMSVVVNNVLIGLAVGDTDSVMNQATLESLRQQVKFIIEIETSMFSRLRCFKTYSETVHTEYPNCKDTLTEKIKNILFGEWNVASDEEEGEEDGGTISEERVEEIVKTRLEKYHKQMIQEFQEFRDDLMEEIKH